MNKFIKNLSSDRYFNVYLVLVMDLIVGLLGSVLVFYISNKVAGLFDSLLTQNCMGFIQMWCLAGTVGLGIGFFIFRTYRSSIRFTTLRDQLKLSLAVLIKVICSISASFVVDKPEVLGDRIWGVVSAWFVFDFTCTITLLVLERVILIAIYDIANHNPLFAGKREQDQRTRILIYGINARAVSVADYMKLSKTYRVVGYISKTGYAKGKTLHDNVVFTYGNAEDISYLKEKYGIQAVIFPGSIIEEPERRELVDYLSENHLSALIANDVESADGNGNNFHVREINVEDLLERPEINISYNEIKQCFSDKVVLVTGAAGSIGSELCRQLATFGVKRLVLFDNAETPMHNLRLELEEKFPQLDFVPIIGDVRIIARLDFVFRKFKPQVVFHAAAYKHVPLMEENPCEAVLVNVVGSRNVADKCVEYNVRKMVMISTDKAVNPTNIMGCTKRLAEIYVQSLGAAIESGTVKGNTQFVTTRFGNVLGSNGSVIPRFKEQIAKGGPITVTHPKINRFFMTIPEACRLVIESVILQVSNKICVFDMGEPVLITHLAERMIELAGYRPGIDIKIEYSGLRPGEKLYEEVLASAENTEPTVHERIKIARVRQYDFEPVKSAVENLETMSRAVEIPAMVQYMKELVPEFISENSVFCKYDQKKRQA